MIFIGRSLNIVAIVCLAFSLLLKLSQYSVPFYGIFDLKAEIHWLGKQR